MNDIKKILIISALFVVGGLQTTFAQEKSEEKNEKVKVEKEKMQKGVDEKSQEMKEQVKEIKKEHQEEVKEIKEKHKEKIEEIEDDNDGQGHQKEMKDKANNEIGAADNQGQGHAYGKNKDGLEGREFGLARAADARNKIESHQDDIARKEDVLRNGRERIQLAKDRLVQAKADGKLSNEEVLKREAKIAEAEKRLQDFENTLKKNKEINKNQKEKLDKVYKEN